MCLLTEHNTNHFFRVNMNIYIACNTHNEMATMPVI